MPGKGTQRLRLTAAALITIIGLGLIASLWYRDLTGFALLDAALGACYLIIGIGLFGRSRFSLFIGATVTAICAAYAFRMSPDPELIVSMRMGGDAITAILCAFVLWRMRHEPSV